VDSADQLRRTLEAVAEVAQHIPVVFPAHPRTARNIDQAELKAVRIWNGDPLPSWGLWMMPPASYLDFLDLMQHAVMVITDSGGVQEETTFLGVPCLTYRDTTERPVTVSMGTNRVVGCDPGHLLLEAAWADAATGLLDIKRLGEFLARIKDRIRHQALSRVSPLSVPILLEIGREQVHGQGQDAMLREAADLLIREAMGDS